MVSLFLGISLVTHNLNATVPFLRNSIIVEKLVIFILLQGCINTFGQSRISLSFFTTFLQLGTHKEILQIVL